MALLLRFSAVKVYEGQTSGRNSDLSLDVSMIETDTENHSVPNAATGTDGKTHLSVLDTLLSPLRSIPAKLAPPAPIDPCLAM